MYPDPSTEPATGARGRLPGLTLLALLCFIFLYLSTVGAGPYGLDSVIERRRSRI